MTKSSGTPLMKQYFDIKSEYDDSIVLFRMGDFYETFNDDAKITAKILGIVLTKRANGAAADVPLAGFPYHALDNYLYKLVNAGHRVAICEQVEDPKLSKGIVKREVIEVVTPGTITAEQAIDQKANRYLASLHFNKTNVGYAILDQSTGEFFIGECEKNNISESLRKFAPREVIIGESVIYSTEKWYLELKPFVTKIDDWVFTFDQSYRKLIDHFQVKSLKGFGCDSYKDGITSAGAILYHVTESLNGSIDHICHLNPIKNTGIMGLDGFTIRNLEIFKSLSTQGTHGTLIDVLDQTITSGGGRLLKQWMNKPLVDRKKINSRLDIVEAFYKDSDLRDEISKLLKQISDIERILGKINNGKVTPKEINELCISLEQIPEIQSALKRSNNKKLVFFNKSFKNTDRIFNKIIKTLDSDAPSKINQGNVILKGVNKELDELRLLSTGGKKWIADLQTSERKRTGISSLKVGYNKVFGYYLEVTKVHSDKIPDDYIRKQTLVSSERYITPALKDYEERILTADEKINVLESSIFNDLCRYIINSARLLQLNALALSRLDLLLTFGELSKSNKYCRPKLTDKKNINIKDGRHPVVEQLIPSTERFIPNNLDMNNNKNQIHLITGPNMAGKSTYLRQIGLIVYMSHLGCFVPANSAEIGVVDKLFTRVGASDNLAGGESTFLVEMNEAANILNNATDKSLILLDEIGRGTATYDGLSLAYAITEYIHNEKSLRARTLFATHYHELTNLEENLQRLENHHIGVKEHGDKIIFLRQILPGPGDKSYGIHVAKMAGLPKQVIMRASVLLNSYLDTESADQEHTHVLSDDQLSIFAEQNIELKNELKEIDLLSLTPLEVISRLDELKKKYDL
ncbi:MAG: DNA mismatch repair protein MutS [Candidatus Neomarinimicrobiota bacterium]|nr:DNA mismatch repair protein MutS [Candidatus Neomarinimicrobiota bacterium]